MPLLLANLRRIGHDDPVVPYLAQQTKIIWLTGVLKTKALEQALEALNQAGIEVVLIKGAALLARWPKEVDTRPMGDFDLLVRPSEIRRAMAVLYAIGWQGPSPESLSDDDIQLFHAFSISNGTGCSIDLHWRPCEAIGSPLHASLVIDRAEGAKLGRTPVRVASLTDHLFILLAHAFEDRIVQRHDWIAEAVFLFERAPAGAWDPLVLSSLGMLFQLTLWCRKATATVAEVSGQQVPSSLSGLSRPSVFESLLQEIELRARNDDRGGWLLAYVTRRNRRARGIVERSLRRASTPAEGIRNALRHIPADAKIITLDRAGLSLAEQPAEASLVAGWAPPEQRGRWSVGKSSLLVFKLPGCRVGEPIEFRLSATANLSGGRDCLTVRAFAGDKVENLTYSRQGLEPGCRLIPGRTMAWRGNVIGALWLEMDAVERQTDLAAYGGDLRQLGLFAWRLECRTGEITELSSPILLSEPLSSAFLRGDWGDPEPSGRWTVGDVGKFVFSPASELRPAAIEVDVRHQLGASSHDIEIWQISGPLERCVASREVSGPGTYDLPLVSDRNENSSFSVIFRRRHPFRDAAELPQGERRPLGLLIGRVALSRQPSEPA